MKIVVLLLQATLLLAQSAAALPGRPQVEMLTPTYQAVDDEPLADQDVDDNGPLAARDDVAAEESMENDGDDDGLGSSHESEASMIHVGPSLVAEAKHVSRLKSDGFMADRASAHSGDLDNLYKMAKDEEARDDAAVKSGKPESTSVKTSPISQKKLADSLVDSYRAARAEIAEEKKAKPAPRAVLKQRGHHQSRSARVDDEPLADQKHDEKDNGDEPKQHGAVPYKKLQRAAVFAHQAIRHFHRTVSSEEDYVKRQMAEAGASDDDDEEQDADTQGHGKKLKSSMMKRLDALRGRTMRNKGEWQQRVHGAANSAEKLLKSRISKAGGKKSRQSELQARLRKVQDWDHSITSMMKNIKGMIKKGSNAKQAQQHKVKTLHGKAAPSIVSSAVRSASASANKPTSVDLRIEQAVATAVSGEGDLSTFGNDFSKLLEMLLKKEEKIYVYELDSSFNTALLPKKRKAQRKLVDMEHKVHQLMLHSNPLRTHIPSHATLFFVPVYAMAYCSHYQSFCDSRGKYSGVLCLVCTCIECMHM
jgi:hypothetical protein